MPCTQVCSFTPLSSSVPSQPESHFTDDQAWADRAHVILQISDRMGMGFHHPPFLEDSEQPPSGRWTSRAGEVIRSHFLLLWSQRDGPPQPSGWRRWQRRWNPVLVPRDMFGDPWRRELGSSRSSGVAPGTGDLEEREVVCMGLVSENALYISSPFILTTIYITYYYEQYS